MGVLVVLSFWNLDCPIENGWKGIKVFKSTRSEVERLYGKPAEESGEAIYRTEDGVIRVIYSSDKCKKASFGRGDFNVPPDTVLEYDVFLKKSIPLSELKWNKIDYERFEDPHILGLIHYGNLKAGIRFTTGLQDDKTEAVGTFSFEGTVEQVNRYQCKADTP
jgi:hypothetical protein